MVAERDLQKATQSALHRPLVIAVVAAADILAVQIAGLAVPQIATGAGNLSAGTEVEDNSAALTGECFEVHIHC